MAESIEVKIARLERIEAAARAVVKGGDGFWWMDGPGTCCDHCGAEYHWLAPSEERVAHASDCAAVALAAALAEPPF